MTLKTKEGLQVGASVVIGPDGLLDYSKLKSVPSIALTDSPALTGTPTAPTATAGTSTTQIATTAFTQTAIANLVASSPAALDTLNELAAALGNDPSFATTVNSNIALKANIASPSLTGVPLAPTAAPSSNGTQIATTAFVQIASNGRLTKSVAGGVTVTLTADEGAYARLRFTGALTANIAVVVPSTDARWDVANLTTGAFTLTVKTLAGTGVIVTQGFRTSLSCDAVNVHETFTDFKDIALTGVSTAITAAANTNTTQIATTAFVQTEIANDLATTAPLMDGVAAVGTAVKLARENHVHPVDTSRAPTANPTFSGVLTAPTILNVMNAPGVIRANLGAPSTEEAALFHGQFNNKLRFIAATTQEESTDGTTWVASTKCSADTLLDIMLGEGQGGSSEVIAGGTIGTYGGYRLTWDVVAQTGYIFLNHLYCYNSTNGNTITFKVEAFHNTNGWVTFATGNASNWPGHVSLKHDQISYSASASQHSKVRVTFSMVRANTNTFSLYGIEWFGGYPSGRRNVEYYDRYKNVYFPEAVGGKRLNLTAATGISPMTVASTTAIANLNADLHDGYHVAEANTASTVAARDSAGDVNVRLLRASYMDEASISGAIAYRINNSTDNYTRYCSSMPAVRTFIGLGNIDNTSDANKPVSTAQQTALNLKANLISPALVTPALGTPTSGSLVNCTFPTLNQSTTGSAGTLTGFTNSNSSNPVSGPDSTTQNTIGYVTGISLLGQSDGAIFSQAYSNLYQAQSFQDYRTGQKVLRGKNNGVWTAWRTVWDSVNLTNLNQLTNGPGFTTNVGTVTGVTATSPVVSSGGVAPVISMPAATTSVAGYLTAADWNTFNGKISSVNPAFTGTPTAPTAAPSNNSTQVATTAFVNVSSNGRLVKSVAGGVTVTLTADEAAYARMAFNGVLTANIAVVVPNTEARWDVANLTTGAFTLTVKTAAGTGVVITQGFRTSLSCDAVNVYETFTDFKDIALTGVSTAITAGAGTNTTQIATTAFVQAEQTSDLATVAPLMDGVAAVGVATKKAREDHVHASDTSRAPLISPTFTGVVTSPTFASTVATGTAPFTVASTTPVPNLSVGGSAASITGTYGGTLTASQVTTALTFTPYSATNPLGFTSNAGTVTGVTATSPVVSTGTTAPVISMPAATTSVAGYLTSADWNTFNGKANIASPTFTGTPLSTTAAPSTKNTQIATTAFVNISSNGRLVKSVAGGATVTLTADEGAYARLAFSGALTANIAVVVPNTEARWDVANLTTGAFTLTVKTAAGTGVIITQGFRTSLSCDTVNVYETFTDFKDIALTGVSTAITAAFGTNTTQIATTAFVQAEQAGDLATVASPMNGTAAVGVSTKKSREDHVHASDTTRAPLASPTFTGTVTLPAGTVAPGIVGSSSPTITAAGTTQATATLLVSDVNIITTAAAGTGVVVPSAASGKYAVIVNRGATPLLVYPAVGHRFDSYAINAPIVLVVGGFLEIFGSSTTQWNTTLNAVINADKISGGVAIINGGTGAQTAAAALTALGAYPASNPNGYTSGGLTAVTGTAPVVSSGGTAPVISMAAATASVAGYLTAANWTTFNAKAPTASPVFSGAVTGGASYTTAPNASTKTLYVGGAPSSSASQASIAVSIGNLHLDSAGTGTMYLNYYGGSGGIVFGNGASTAVASISNTGALSATSFTGPLTGNASTATASGGPSFFANAPSSEAQIGVSLTGYSPVYMYTNATDWGIYSNSGGSIMAYNRASATAAFSGNAATATQLRGGVVDWQTYRSNTVSNMLGWKNYGNGHVIFDASAGTSPTGSAVSNTYPVQAWTPTYPVLMGWNGSTTYGVRVDSARQADQLSPDVQNSRITGALVGMAMGLGDQSGARGSFTCRASGTGDANLAGVTFWHNDNASQLGMRNDGYFGLGGWSRSAWSWYSDPGGNMTASGNVTAYSDPRLKENITPIESPMSILLKLNGVRFSWRHGFPHIAVKAGKCDIGVLANEVEAVLPEIVTESIPIDGKSYKTVAYEKLVPVLIEAMKELKSDNDALRSDIAEMKKEFAQFKSAMTRS